VVSRDSRVESSAPLSAALDLGAAIGATRSLHVLGFVHTGKERASMINDIPRTEAATPAQVRS
jgi:hypothetical protein